MEIELVCVGKTFQPFVNEGCKEFENRLKHYTKFTYTEIKSGNSKIIDVEKLKKLEGEMIMNSIPAGAKVILLDDKGKTFTSPAFSGFILQNIDQAVKKIYFVVGGAYGFSEEVYAKAHSKISLSAFTFSHQMVRLIFIEQLYRAFTIIKGEKYHHE